MKVYVKTDSLMEEIVALNQACFTGLECAPAGVIRDTFKRADVWIARGQTAGMHIPPLLGAALVALDDPRFKGDPYIWSIATRAGVRGQGVASRLIEGIACDARENHGKGVVLICNTNNADAIRLYTKLGFVVKKFVPHYYGDGGDGLIMRRGL